ncbi:hypothetical protein [Streptomyces sp. NPDC059819]|uniref:hypothetical protein n=1 Tax=Streptomyces sp. NPDC059819 TaxID=3346963 RepID=UPI003666C9B0
MKRNCPECRALRDKAAQRDTDLEELLVETALHEAASPQCKDSKPVKRAPRQ